MNCNQPINLVLTNYIYEHNAIFQIWMIHPYPPSGIIGLRCYSVVSPPDYHIVVNGFGGKGYLVGREEEPRLENIVKEAQRECKDGKAVLLNVLIGKTNFRDGSISV